MGALQSARNSRPDVRIQPRAARQVLEESDATLTRLRKHDAETRSHHGISVHVGEEGEEREGFALLRSSAHGHAVRCYRQPAERLEMEQTGRLTHLTGSSPGSDRVGPN